MAFNSYTDWVRTLDPVDADQLKVLLSINFILAFAVFAILVWCIWMLKKNQ